MRCDPTRYRAGVYTLEKGRMNVHSVRPVLCAQRHPFARINTSRGFAPLPGEAPHETVLEVTDCPPSILLRSIPNRFLKEW